MPDKLINKTFGKLKVISEGPLTKLRVRRWLCQCSCGNTLLTTKYNLTHGLSKSCGCFNREQDLTGKVYGQLKVLSRAKNIKSKKSWLCKCSCGSLVVVKANHLKTGTKSCGCLKRKNDLINLKIKKRKIKNKHDLIAHFFRNYKKSALYRKLEFTIILEEFSELIQRECFYCGNLPMNTKKSSNFIIKYNGLDRVDNTKGYIKSNCVTCCPMCNNAKKDHSLKAFKEWALKLGDHINFVLKREYPEYFKGVK